MHFKLVDYAFVYLPTEKAMLYLIERLKQAGFCEYLSRSSEPADGNYSSYGLRCQDSENEKLRRFCSFDFFIWGKRRLPESPEKGEVFVIELSDWNGKLEDQISVVIFLDSRTEIDSGRRLKLVASEILAFGLPAWVGENVSVKNYQAIGNVSLSGIEVRSISYEEGAGVVYRLHYQTSRVLEHDGNGVPTKTDDGEGEGDWPMEDVIPGIAELKLRGGQISIRRFEEEGREREIKSFNVTL